MTERCKKCGEPIFEAIPGKTTSAEIRTFAQSAPAFKDTSIPEDGWIHPGSYCPNGCTATMRNYGSRKLWEKFDKEQLEEEKLKTSALHVRKEFTPRGVGFSVYVNGNIQIRFNESESDQILRLRPGKYRCSVKEDDVRRQDRLTSNEVHFVLNRTETVELQFRLEDEMLRLELV